MHRTIESSTAALEAFNEKKKKINKAKNEM